MHIPDGFLTPSIWGSLDILSGSFLAVGLRKVSHHLEERAIPLMGVLAAFVFAAQMINLPIGGGTSAHFLGGTLVGILLGPWAGLVLLAVVLIVQCFLFQDGGVAALGANIFNMGIIGSLLSAYLYRGLVRGLKIKSPMFWSGFLASWVSISFSAIACTAELASSRVISWRVGLYIIVGTHFLLGFLEGLVTGTILESLVRTRPDLLKFSKT